MESDEADDTRGKVEAGITGSCDAIKIGTTSHTRARVTILEHRGSRESGMIIPRKVILTSFGGALAWHLFP